MLGPGAGPHEHGDEHQVVAVPAAQQVGDLHGLAEGGVEEILGQEAHGHRRLAQRLADLFVPRLSRGNAAIAPEIDVDGARGAAQERPEALGPGVVLVGVGEEDGVGHQGACNAGGGGSGSRAAGGKSCPGSEVPSPACGVPRGVEAAPQGRVRAENTHSSPSFGASRHLSPQSRGRDIAEAAVVARGQDLQPGAIALPGGFSLAREPILQGACAAARDRGRVLHGGAGGRRAGAGLRDETWGFC